MNIDVIALTRSYPKSTIFFRRVRAALSRRPYFFNRQKMRLEVFRRINARVEFDNYVETGTFLGMTTHFLAQTAQARASRVYSCEVNEDHYAVALRTVGHFDNVRLHCGNSVDFLRQLTSKLSAATNFVYLDAHWYEYLPLRDELSILKDWPNTIVMIDDFKVPFDSGFGWDKYDDEREICLAHIAGCFGDNSVYFPNYSTDAEGGGPARGYCVIPMSARIGQVLDQVELLRKFEK